MESPDFPGWFNHRVQLRQTSDTLKDPFLHQTFHDLVDHLDIVVILGPVISNEQHVGALLMPAGTKR